MSEITYYQRNRDIIEQRNIIKITKNYCEIEQRNRYRSLSEDEKDIKKEYQKDKYHNKSDEEKQRLKDYQKNYREAKKLKSILNQCEK